MTLVNDVAVIILTYNEEKNLSHALASVCGWAREVHVVDSYSNDRTEEIASRYACQFVKNKFESEPKQRNWAMSNLGVEAEWIFFLDADEWMPDVLKQEISAVIASRPEQNGFYLRWRLIWMGKWVRRGYYPKWLLRLVRRGKAEWEYRTINPHLSVKGPTGRLENDFIHEDRKGLQEWSEKHIRYARQEAEELARRTREADNIDPDLFGSQAQRVRWVRLRIYNKIPPLMRPFCYFFFRVVIRMGILDGWRAMIYHFLHAFWCPLLIDLFYLEMRGKTTGKTAPQMVGTGTEAHDTRA